MKLAHLKLYKAPAIIAGAFFFLLPNYNVCAQQADVQNDLLMHRFSLYTMNGKSFENPNTGVDGTPFFLETWKYGKIILNDSKVFFNIQFRLNLQTEEVHFKQPDSIEMVAPQGLIKEVVLFDTVNNRPLLYMFQCGFPAIDNQNVLSFYQVLSNGKIKLLKSLRKTIHEEKDGLSGEVKKEFRQYEDYYFFTDNKMERIKRDKNYILGFMKDKNDLINDFLQKNKISFKSTDDIKKIIDYYNSLF